MNGRAYDYNLGRFLSVDPFIQAPGNSQSLNPYSYIMNNPLSGTDPSGYTPKCDSDAAASCPKPKERKKSKRNRARDGLQSTIATRNGSTSTVTWEQRVSGSTDEVNQEIADLEGVGFKVKSNTANSDGSSEAVLTKTYSVTVITGATGRRDSSFGVDDAISLGIGFTPSGVVADVYVAVTGEDMFTQEEVSGLWRYLGLIPFAGEIRKFGNSADTIEGGLSVIRNGDGAVGEFWSRAVTFQGNKVYQRNDLINPSLVDSRGRSNLERMRKGLAPIGPDGMSMNLHHMTQRQQGAIAEMSQSFHINNRGTIHINPNSTPSGINRAQFNKWRSNYWKNRANDF